MLAVITCFLFFKAEKTNLFAAPSEPPINSTIILTSSLETRFIKFLLKNGAKNIIVTQGVKGSIVCIKSKNYKIKPFPAQRLADVTGAGDSYLAGFVRALELFDDPLKQGEFAAMTATMSIEDKGSFHHGIKDVYKRLSWRI